jgi:hypothetical protein
VEYAKKINEKGLEGLIKGYSEIFNAKYPEWGSTPSMFGSQKGHKTIVNLLIGNEAYVYA